MKRRALLVTPLVLASSGAPWVAARAGSAPAQPGEPVRWPHVTLLDGQTLAPAHWVDRAAVVVFWTTTCPFCRRHNAHVQRLHEAARATGAAITVLGVARERDRRSVQAHVARHGYGFPVTLDAEPLRAALASRNMVPLTATVRRDGRLAQVLPGEMFEDDVMELLNLARAERRS